MVRRAIDSDAGEVARIMRECVVPVWTDEQVRSSFDSENTDIYVYDDGKVRGYVIAENVLDERWIASIAVDAEVRHRGIGKALLSSALVGAGYAYLEVNEHNAPAIALYEACGFRAEGLRKRYYGEASAIIMTRRET